MPPDAPELDIGEAPAAARPRRPTMRERLDAIPEAIRKRDEMLARIDAAAGDAGLLADLMAEAIGMWRAARGQNQVGRDGRVLFTTEEMSAAHCADRARELYLAVSGKDPSV